MNWKSLAHIESLYAGALSAVACRGRLVFRSLNELSSWDLADLAAPKWSYSLADDAPMGAKSVIAMKQMVVTYNDPAVDEIPRRIQVFDPLNGVRLWIKELPILITRNGLFTNGDDLYVHGYAADQYAYFTLQLDPQNGAVVGSQPSEDVRVAIATRDAVILGGLDAVYAYEQNNDRPIVYPATAASLCKDVNTVYVHYYDSTHTPNFAWWEGSPENERGCVSLKQVRADKTPGAFLAPLFEPGKVVFSLYIEGAGVWGIDIGGGRVMWRVLDEDDLLVNSITGTPYGPVIHAKRNHESMLFMVNARTGTAQPIRSQLVVITATFWLANHLIVTGLDEAEIFNWLE